MWAYLQGKRIITDGKKDIQKHFNQSPQLTRRAPCNNNNSPSLQINMARVRAVSGESWNV